MDGRELYNLNAQLQHRRRAAAEAELARLRADTEAALERERADAEAARERMARLLGSAATRRDSKTAEEQQLQAVTASKVPLWMPQLPPLLGYAEAQRQRQPAADAAKRWRPTGPDEMVERYRLLTAEVFERERQMVAESAERERKRARVRAAEAAERRRPAIDQMTGREFEDYVADRLRRDGWEVRDTPVTGDWGVDLIAVKGRWFAVQCKRSAVPVGIAAVQQVVAGADYYECRATMVVSNQEFTQAAKSLAATHNCVLIGRSKLPMTPWMD